MSAARPRRRDPEGRREQILQATVDVIAEHGVAGATHRLIAERAGVPLGSTTYYFPTLTDLTAEALEAAVATYDQELSRWEQTLTGCDDIPATLVELASEYLDDHTTALVEYELYVAAAREESLRPAAQMWVDRLTDILTPFVTPIAAKAITMLLDGAIVQAIALDRQLDTETLLASIRAVRAHS